MITKKLILTILLTLSLFTNISCSADTGPSNEMAKRTINKSCLKSTNGLAGCVSKVLSRKTIASDLVKIELEWQLVRTEKKADMKLLAMAVLNKKSEQEAFYRARSGTILNITKGVITYVKKGDAWVVDGIGEK